MLAGLDAEVGDVVRFVVKTNPAPAEMGMRLAPIYNDKETRLQLEGFHKDALEHFAGYRQVPGNKISVVTNLVFASPHCVFAHVARDYGPVVEQPDPDLADQWIAIVPKDPARDPDGTNPTGWMYIYDGFEVKHTTPKNPCADPS